MNKTIKLILSASLALTLAVPAAMSADRGFRAREHTQSREGYAIDDVEAEITFGREVAARILGTFPIDRREDLADYVNMVGLGLAMQSYRTELTYRFVVLDTDLVNAFAAPGGYVFVTTGTLKKVQSEAELAAILAHEISHINGRHIVKEMEIRASDQSVISGLARIISGSTDSVRIAMKQITDAAVNILLKRGYKLEDELDADRQALTLLATAGYDPTALPRVVTRITDEKEKGKESSVSATHPGLKDRTANIEASIKDQELANFKGKLGVERFKENIKL